MSDGFSRMASPGQRTSSTRTPITEVWITLQHAFWASVVGGVLAVVVRFFAIIPLARELMKIRQIAPLVLDTEPRFSGALLISVMGAPWMLLVLSFGAQILNINFPPDYGAANPAAGFFGGMFKREKATYAVEETPYTGRANPIPDPEQTPVPVEILIRNEATGQTKRANIPDLTLADWQRLARYFQRGRASVSQADLEKEAGFSRGPNGRARAVNHALTAWSGLVGVGEHEKPMAIPAFRQWVIDRGYARNIPLPHP